MNQDLPDIHRFEVGVFKDGLVFARLLGMALDLTGGLQAGLIQGTDSTGEAFLDPASWDRGTIRTLLDRNRDPDASKAQAGEILPNDLPVVSMYRTDQDGNRYDNEGVIAYVLRRFQDFYSRGIRVLLMTDLESHLAAVDQEYATLPVLSWDGNQFASQSLLKVTVAIVRRFSARNFIAAYVPDFGAVVINTADPMLLETREGRFVRHQALAVRLNLLIQCIETASLAILGHVQGPRGAELLWRKERQLRKTAQELSRQKAYLRAVGGITEAQLTMQPQSLAQGIYAFIDMKGSVRFRQACSPGEYLLTTNLFRQMGADIANHFSCRLVNFLGDGLFFQNVSLFDPPDGNPVPAMGERGALMLLVIASLFREMELLVQGDHPADPARVVPGVVSGTGLSLEFRAGIHVGPATIGPVGSQHRMMVTAIGEGVDTASRLESTAPAGQIHVSGEFMALLEPVLISNSVSLLRESILKPYPGGIPMFQAENQVLARDREVPFLFWYGSGFPEGVPVATPFGPVAFKEFYRKRTYLFHWNRKSRPVDP